MTDEILNITEKTIISDSIEEYEYRDYDPVTGTSLNKSGNISIVIESQDLWINPSNSYILIEGQLTKQDGTEYADVDNVALTHNGIMQLFNTISYSLSAQEIERVDYPGQATTMFGLVTYPTCISNTGLNFLWEKDTEIEVLKNKGFSERHDYLFKNTDLKGSFSFCIPLKHIFGFAADYDKVIYGFRHELRFDKKSDTDDSIFRDDKAAPGKVNITRLTWMVPLVVPKDIARMQLFKIIENKETLDVNFRNRYCNKISVPQTTHFTWRLSTKASPECPRWVIITFQTNKSSDQTKNASIFDHLNLNNIYVKLNSRDYPSVKYDLSFSKMQFSRAFLDAVDFSTKYFGIDDNCFSVKPSDYKKLYPIFVIDIKNQKEKMKGGITDITVEAFFSKNVPINTDAFALVISDKMIKFQSDGNKMAVVQN